MKRSILISYAIFFGSALISYSCGPGAESKANANAPEMNAKVAVKTAAVIKQPVNRMIERSATLAPFEEVHFSPASPGRIESLKVNVGDRVKKGTLIAIMDQTQLNQARVQLANLETEFSRVDTLIKTGSIPQQQYDQVKAQYDIAKTNYEFLQKNTRLTAPFQGIISGKYYEEGEMYSGAPIPQIGKAAIVSIVGINPIKALVSVSERYFPSMTKGMKVQTKSDIYPEESFAGEIIRIHPLIDQSTRTFQVEVKADNPDEKLRPGMFVRVNLLLGNEEALLAPAIAVLKQTGTNDRYVFVNQQGKAVRKEVTVGKVFDDNLEITSGLKEGEELVVVGQNKLSDEAELEIVD